MRVHYNESLSGTVVGDEVKDKTGEWCLPVWPDVWGPVPDSDDCAARLVPSWRVSVDE